MDNPRVLVHPADDSGCGHLRMIWPAAQAAAAGLDVTVADMHIEVTHRGPIQNGRRPVIGIECPDTDVVVVQRPLNADLVEALELMQAAGIAVVVDLDDDFSAVSRNNIAWSSCHPRFSPHENTNWLARACRHADLVTVTTQALADRYGAHGRCLVLPNYLPADIAGGGAAAPLLDRPPVIGWTGNTRTHPNDLQVTRGAVARVVRDTDATVAVVGYPDRVDTNLGLPAGTTEACGWLPFTDYHRSLVGAFDIGIVPLEDTAFNAAKSSLKALELAAAGAAVVASPTPDNQRVAADGVCLIASKPKHWEATLRRLVVDRAYRVDVAAAAQAGVARHTIEEHGWRWAEAWAIAAAGVKAGAA